MNACILPVVHHAAHLQIGKDLGLGHVELVTPPPDFSLERVGETPDKAILHYDGWWMLQSLPGDDIRVTDLSSDAEPVVVQAERRGLNADVAIMGYRLACVLSYIDVDPKYRMSTECRDELDRAVQLFTKSYVNKHPDLVTLLVWGPKGIRVDRVAQEDAHGLALRHQAAVGAGPQDYHVIPGFVDVVLTDLKQRQYPWRILPSDA